MIYVQFFSICSSHSCKPKELRARMIMDKIVQLAPATLTIVDG